MIRTDFARDKTARKNLPILGAIKFGMMNFTSNNIKQYDMSRSARVLIGNCVKENLLPPNYKSFPGTAMLRFDQERGENLDRIRVRIPEAINSRQTAPVTTAPIRRVMTYNVPSWELARMKAAQEEELKQLMEPTSLVGAVKALNVKNSDVRDSRLSQGAQQRLRQKSRV